MASPGNQHCASCIGTLSFPMRVRPTDCCGGECNGVHRSVVRLALEPTDTSRDRSSLSFKTNG